MSKISSIIFNYESGDSDVFVRSIPAPAPVDPISVADADVPVDQPVDAPAIQDVSAPAVDTTNN